MKLLTSEELEEHRAEFIDGKILANGKLLEDGQYIFVLDPKKKNLSVGINNHSGHYAPPAEILKDQAPDADKTKVTILSSKLHQAVVNLGKYFQNLALKFIN